MVYTLDSKVNSSRRFNSPGGVMAPYAEEGCKVRTAARHLTTFLSQLFVYGINESISNSEIQEAFEKYGQVVDTYNTGKGYAFVTYGSKEDAATVGLKLEPRGFNP
jgi:hypothetical protein